MSDSSPGLSVVIPVYGNADTLAVVVDRLEELATRLPDSLEVVFVVDGSPDGSGPLLERLLAESPLEAQLLWHSRNFGSFAAIRTGLAHARGRWVAVMAADLQEPIDLVEAFAERLSSGEFDVAIGVRASREDPRSSQAASSLFWRFYRRWVQREMPLGGVDVFACTADVRDVLVRMGESHTSLVGLLMWVGYRRTEVQYGRAARPSGTSGWTLKRKLRYLLDSLFSFTDLPITLLLAIGVTGVLVSLLGGIAVFVAWATGSIEVPGYTPLMLALLGVGFLLLSGLGIVGSYVWRTYENTKERPSAIVMQRHEYPARSAGSQRHVPVESGESAR